MIATLAQIWRHPIKGIGTEPLDSATLAADRPLPGDRAWAVHHGGAPEGTQGWRPCNEFLRGAGGPALMAVMARTGPDGRIALSHPERPQILIDPETDAERLLSWLLPLWPDARPDPARLVRAPAQGMTDAAFPSVAVLNLASLRALSGRAGRDLDPRRFRGNLWLDGLAPWEEFDLVGRSIRIGAATLRIEERITRCRATEANPETGKRDTATLSLLQEGYGHQDFGVYARVTKGGAIATGDSFEVLP